MIQRYTNPEMGRIWSEQRRYETWLQVEVAAAEAMAAAGIVPVDAARDLKEKGAFDIARIDEIEKTTQHDVIAFTTSVAEIVGPSARWLHFGLTSSDVVDTAQALQMVEACDLVLENLAALGVGTGAGVRRRATPLASGVRGRCSQGAGEVRARGGWSSSRSRRGERLVGRLRPRPARIAPGGIPGGPRRRA